MMKLVTRPIFYEDVAEEVENLARRAGPKIATRWHAAVEQTIRQIQRHPGIGRPRPELTPSGIRSWRVDHFRRWLIFYAVENNSVVILRVRYGMMDLTALEFE